MINEGRALLEIDCQIFSETGEPNAESTFVWYLKGS